MYDVSLNKELVIYDDLNMAVQELDILFNTENTELLGNTDFGTNFSEFLWQSTPSPQQLRNYVIDKISNYCIYVQKFKYNVEVNINSNVSDIEDMYHLVITLTSNGNAKGKTARRVYNLR